MTNLFIDSNILLNLYHYSNDDLTELEKLIALVKSEHIEVITTKQVYFEFYRNRENKIKNVIAEVKKSFSSPNLPISVRNYEESVEFSTLCKKLKQLQSKILTRAEEDAKNKSFSADNLVKELFDNAIWLNSESASVLKKAQARMLRGNPPGKNGSFGDAINWETLLSLYKKEEKLHFVTFDSDYFSDYDASNCNELLAEEWLNKYPAGIKVYQSLNGFFKENHIEIDLKVEEEKEGLVMALLNSENFYTTHTKVRQLNDHNLSKRQKEMLVTGALENSQIYWIASDPDVNGFFWDIYRSVQKYLKKEIRDQFEEVFYRDWLSEDEVGEQASSV